MNKINLVILLISTVFSFSSHASIINSTFDNELRGWSTDSATLGSPGYDTDFDVVNGRAEIYIDYSFTNEFIVNVLFQSLDLTVNPNEKLLLSFDWDFFGEEQGLDPDPFVDGADYWVAILFDANGDAYGADGEFGFLAESSGYGQGSFSAYLDESFFNASDWSIGFELLAGWDFNGLGSTLAIDNVTLVREATDVPEPATLGLVFLASLLMLRQKRYQI